MSDDDFQIQPDEWYTATVYARLGSNSFAVLSNNEEVFISSRVVPTRRDGHECLQVDQEIAVRIKKNEGRSTGWTALEAIPDVPPKYPKEMVGVLTKWNGRGFATLECGCSVYVISSSNDQNHQVGDRLTFVLRHRLDGRAYFTVQQNQNQEVVNEEKS
jgi:hypothetical protein